MWIFYFLLSKKGYNATIMISSLIYSRATSYFCYFIVCIFVLQAFQCSYGYMMVRFLISATFRVAALLRGRCLLEGAASSDLNVKGAALNRRWRWFEARQLLEKIPITIWIILVYIYIYIDDFPENSSFSKNAKRPDEQMNNEHLHYKKAINGKKQIFRT